MSQVVRIGWVPVLICSFCLDGCLLMAKANVYKCFVVVTHSTETCIALYRRWQMMLLVNYSRMTWFGHLRNKNGLGVRFWRNSNSTIVVLSSLHLLRAVSNCTSMPCTLNTEWTNLIICWSSLECAHCSFQTTSWTVVGCFCIWRLHFVQDFSAEKGETLWSFCVTFGAHQVGLKWQKEWSNLLQSFCCLLSGAGDHYGLCQKKTARWLHQRLTSQQGNPCGKF